MYRIYEYTMTNQILSQSTSNIIRLNNQNIKLSEHNQLEAVYYIPQNQVQTVLLHHMI